MKIPHSAFLGRDSRNQADYTFSCCAEAGRVTCSQESPRQGREAALHWVLSHWVSGLGRAQERSPSYALHRLQHGRLLWLTESFSSKRSTISPLRLSSSKVLNIRGLLVTTGNGFPRWVLKAALIQKRSSLKCSKVKFMCIALQT